MGDASHEHGGDIAGHQTHEVGLDIDIRPMRTPATSARWGVDYRWSTYDRAATRDLVKAIRATAPGHVKLIYFNDPCSSARGWSAGTRGTTTISTSAIASGPIRWPPMTVEARGPWRGPGSRRVSRPSP